MCGYMCDCGCETSRHFVSKEEKIEALKEYKDSLEKEAKGVSEAIKKMEKNN